MSTAQKLESPLSALEMAVEAALSYFHGSDTTSQRMVAVWGPQEVLSHLLYWHEAMTDWMETIMSGGGPNIRNASTDDLNAQAVTQHVGEGIPELISQFRKAHERLAQATQQISDLDTVILVILQAAKGTQVKETIRERLKGMAEHWIEHITELQRSVFYPANAS